MAGPDQRHGSLTGRTSDEGPAPQPRHATQMIEAYRQGVKRVLDFYEGADDLSSKLAVAVSRGDAPEAVRFIELGADVNRRQEGRLPLIHEAIGFGFGAIVEAMLASGRCDLTVRDAMGRLPSDVAELETQDYVLADRLAEEQARQFHAKGMDPRRPENPDYGNWKWEP